MRTELTEAALRVIVEGGETYEIEFKGEKREPLSDRDLVETVVCLANGRGGILLIGVEDDGTITGAHHRHNGRTDPRLIEALVANRTVPPCPVACRLHALQEGMVIALHVPDGQPTTSTTEGLYKRRGLGGDGKPACLPYTSSEMHIRLGDRGENDFSGRILREASWTDLDPVEIKRVRETVRKNRGRSDQALLELSDVDLLKALGLGSGDEELEDITLAALLLVGREESLRRLVPTHEAAFQVRSGTRLAVNDFTTAPLVRLSEDFAIRFDAYNEEEEIAVGMVRVGIPNYSPQGFREALHNALIHRDYARIGAVHVQLFHDRLEVSNPGGFVEGVRPDNILVVPPKPRNRILADAFKRIGLVERSGRGVDSIYEGQLRYGRPIPDYSLSASDTVHVALRGGPANLALARWIIEHDEGDRPITVDEMLVVNTVDRERSIDVAIASSLMQRSESAARSVIKRLVERGVLETRGRKRDRSYGFTAPIYRALGHEDAYVRASRFSDLQQEQMILKYVRKNGRITRSEAANLCRIDPQEARGILARLVDEEKLKLVSKRRWSYYHLPS